MASEWEYLERSHVNKLVVDNIPVTPALWGRQAGPGSSPASQSTELVRFRVTDRPCLSGIRQRAIEEDTSAFFRLPHVHEKYRHGRHWRPSRGSVLHLGLPISVFSTSYIYIIGTQSIVGIY